MPPKAITEKDLELEIEGEILEIQSYFSGYKTAIVRKHIDKILENKEKIFEIRIKQLKNKKA